MRTPLELAALATAAVPGLQVTAVLGPQVMEPGISSTRIQDAEGNVWTVTATDEVLDSQTLTRRAELLSFLSSCTQAELIPFAVPQIRAWAGTGEGTYALVASTTPGLSLGEEQLLEGGLLSASVGRALASLHNLEAEAFHQLGVRTHEIEQIRAEILGSISATGRELPGRLRKRWVTALKEDVLWCFDPAPTHGDLTLGNILSSHDAVRSILECEKLELADPAVDLAWLLPLVSNDFLERLIAAYSGARRVPDLHLFTRAQLYSELALLDWLRFGLTNRDAEIVTQAQQMLTDLDEDLGGALLIVPSRPVVEVHFEASDEPLNRIARAGESTKIETEPHEFDSAPRESVISEETAVDQEQPSTDPREAETTVLAGPETSV